MTFETNGPMAAVTHTPGSASLVVETAGTYLVDWKLGFAYSALHFCVAVNGTTIPGSCSFFQASPSTGGLSFTAALAAGDSLSLVNQLTYAVGISGSNSPIPAISGALRIVRIQ
jgi:hypothetical protein